MTIAKSPDYRKPPVVEVAIAVQFAPLREMTAAHVGLYWKTIQEVFGKAEEQAPILPQHEPVSMDDVQGGAGLAFGIGKPPMPRLWFIDSSETRIIQVQRDKFIHNWRKMSETDGYPEFARIREDFLGHWDGFLRFLKESRLPSPEITQCELTYVNRIKEGQGWASMADLGNVFSPFAWRTSGTYLPSPEKVQWAAHFTFPGQPGRLHVEMVPVRLPPPGNAKTIQLVLTARGRPEGAIDPKSMNDWFDIAHEWIVKGFVDLADKKTDALWERLA